MANEKLIIDSYPDDFALLGEYKNKLYGIIENLSDGDDYRLFIVRLLLGFNATTLESCTLLASRGFWHQSMALLRLVGDYWVTAIYVFEFAKNEPDILEYFKHVKTISYKDLEKFASKFWTDQRKKNNLPDKLRYLEIPLYRIAKDGNVFNERNCSFVTDINEKLINEKNFFVHPNPLYVYEFINFSPNKLAIGGTRIDSTKEAAVLSDIIKWYVIEIYTIKIMWGDKVAISSIDWNLIEKFIEKFSVAKLNFS